jgi:hypothetical protein
MTFKKHTLEHIITRLHPPLEFPPSSLHLHPKFNAKIVLRDHKIELLKIEVLNVYLYFSKYLLYLNLGPTCNFFDHTSRFSSLRGHKFSTVRNHVACHIPLETT